MDLWKPDATAKRLINRGEKKIREAEKRRSEKISRERAIDIARREYLENVTNVPF